MANAGKLWLLDESVTGGSVTTALRMLNDDPMQFDWQGDEPGDVYIRSASQGGWWKCWLTSTGGKYVKKNCQKFDEMPRNATILGLVGPPVELYLDPDRFHSVGSAIKLLNKSPQKFDWRGLFPGHPVFVRSSSQGEWYLCKSNKQGVYSHRTCAPDVEPNEDAVQLYFRGSTKRHRGADEEEEKRAERAATRLRRTLKGAVRKQAQAWLSENISFDPKYNLDAWADGKGSQSEKLVLVSKGTVWVKRGKDRRLPVGVFTQTMRSFGLGDDMFETQDTGMIRTFSILPTGQSYIYDNYNTRASMKALLLGVMRGRNGGGDSAVSGFGSNVLFDANLLKEVKGFL